MASLKPQLPDFESSEVNHSILDDSSYHSQSEENITEEKGKTSGFMGRLFRLQWNSAKPSEHDRGRELRRAVRAGDLIKIKTMLKEGVGVNESQEASLACIATRRNNVEILKILIDAKVDINQGDRRNKSSRIRTPLHESARKGWIEGIKLLLDANAEVDKADDNGATALFLALRSGHLKAAELLLAAGASVEGVAVKNRQMPLHAATTVEAVELLLSYNVNLESRDKNGRTAFLLNTKEGRLNVIKLLKERGANIQSTDNLHRNALFMAGGKGDVAGIFAFLISAGVDTNHRDIDGNTFLHLAALRANDVKHLKWLSKEFKSLWVIENKKRDTPSLLLEQRNFFIDL